MEETEFGREEISDGTEIDPGHLDPPGKIELRTAGSRLGYSGLYSLLKSVVNRHPDGAVLPDFGVTVRSMPFVSRRRYRRRNDALSEESVFSRLSASDGDVEENRSFRFRIFVPDGYGPGSDSIILFHGLNERYWNKYLPWALALAENTGCAVALFPLAFHMNRAPGSWSSPRLMRMVAGERESLYPGLRFSSLANAAISRRLQSDPERFLLSGMQSFDDAVALTEMIARGEGVFEAGGRIHLFGYSVGALLSQVILMTDPGGLFNSSRLFLFCGGAVLERTAPVSKTIMDEEAYRAVAGFLDSVVRGNGDWLAERGLSGETTERAFGYFRCMIGMESFGEHRDARLLDLSDRIAAIGLTKDRVFPPQAIRETLRGRSGRIPISFTELDFPYEYRHEDPFPRNGSEPILPFFAEVFGNAGRFISGY